MFEAGDGGVVGVSGGAAEGILLHVEAEAEAFDVSGEGGEGLEALGREWWLWSTRAHEGSVGGVVEVATGKKCVWVEQVWSREGAMFPSRTCGVWSGSWGGVEEGIEGEGEGGVLGWWEAVAQQGVEGSPGVIWGEVGAVPGGVEGHVEGVGDAPEQASGDGLGAAFDAGEGGGQDAEVVSELGLGEVVALAEGFNEEAHGAVFSG